MARRYAIFIKYALVGLMGTVIDMGSLYLFVEHLHLHLLLATAMSFILAASNNSVLNRYWTFRNKKGDIEGPFLKLLAVSAIGLLLTELAMSLLVYGLKIWYMASKLITSGMVLIWNFLANKWWAFKDRIPHVPRKERYAYAVSVIVPAYNEQKRISKTLEAIDEYFSGKPLTRQIIVVDDGSSDKTVEVVEGLRKQIADLSVLPGHPNRGKGYAIKRGVEASQGEYILFTDADNSTPIEEFEKIYPLLRDTPVVIGSRYMTGSNVVVKQPRHRVLIGRFANMLIRVFILDGVRDTQCGFKAFRHEAARELFGRMKVHRFGFDIEILAIARLLNFAVREVPVSWYNSGESRVRPVKDALRTFRELIYIKINLWGGRYS